MWSSRGGYAAPLSFIAIATAGGRVGRKDVDRVLRAGQELYDALAPIYAQRDEVVLDATLLARLGLESWGATMEEFKLNPPVRENISR